MDISSYYSVDEKFVQELFLLQSELVKLQKYVAENKIRIAIIFEGRDAAGKGAAIRRFTQFLNPQNFDTIALGKPTEVERGQWYFQRYVSKLPDAGEMVFFDRSWYNRAVVEPVMGFCSTQQYELFMKQVVDFEKMLVDDGIILVKFWYSIDSFNQQMRIQKRINSPLEKWKVSPVDLAAQEKWEQFSKYKEKMFEVTSTSFSPWINIKGLERENMRIQSMLYVLSLIEYDNKSEAINTFDPLIVNKLR